MKIFIELPFRLRSYLLAGWLVCLATAVQAQAIWHCSRQSKLAAAEAATEVVMNREDTFQIASMGNDPDVIGITLRDLLDVYSGLPVRVGNLPLTACFQNDRSSVSRDTLELLGLSANAMTALARKSSIVRSQLELVSNEAEMMSCMVKNPPAVGYFVEVQDTDDIGSCF